MARGISRMMERWYRQKKERVIIKEVESGDEEEKDEEYKVDLSI